jgi:spore coat polysaccharide biosynthesis protein SpsF
MIGIIIQARMSSSRLPNKVLKEINGRPMLSYLLERVKAAKKVDLLILATSDQPSDDPIEETCKTEDVICYRGNLEDVLDRYYQSALIYNLDVVVRITADCPIIDPQVIDTLLEIFENNGYDYIANTLQPDFTYPEGMDVEIFSFQNLKLAWQNTRKPSDREHVTFHFWQNPEQFSIYRHDLKESLSHYRLTVDYIEDFEVVEAIINGLYQTNPLFTLKDIIHFLEQHPDVAAKNMDITPNQGWQSAFEKDKQEGF